MFFENTSQTVKERMRNIVGDFRALCAIQKLFHFFFPLAFRVSESELLLYQRSGNSPLL